MVKEEDIFLKRRTMDNSTKLPNMVLYIKNASIKLHCLTLGCLTDNKFNFFSMK